MNYETAKKLKDAGFPQPKEYSANWIKSPDASDVKGQFDTNGIPVWDKSVKEIMQNYAYAPVLEELISALGDKFGKLERVDGLWGAAEADPGTHAVLADDPVIATGKLWLILNKKV